MIKQVDALYIYCQGDYRLTLKKINSIPIICTQPYFIKKFNYVSTWLYLTLQIRMIKKYSSELNNINAKYTLSKFPICTLLDYRNKLRYISNNIIDFKYDIPNVREYKSSFSSLKNELNTLTSTVRNLEQKVITEINHK